MEAEDLDRYKELLLAKRRQLLVARSSNLVLAPPGDESRGDLVEQASAEAEAKVHILWVAKMPCGIGIND